MLQWEYVWLDNLVGSQAAEPLMPAWLAQDRRPMSDSDHAALGQALGYVYQFERATYRLLEADKNVVQVGVEHVDDVSLLRADGTGIREQDKATIRDGRPLSDRSVAFWKTLAIWAVAVHRDPALLLSTEFHLVTNGAVAPNSLAARIHAATAAPETNSLAMELLTMAEGLRDDLQTFGAQVRAVPSGVLASLIGRIFVFDSVSVSFGGKLEELQSLRLLGNLQRMAVFDNAAGWVRRAVLTAAREGKPPLIDRAEFDREMRALFRRVAVAPLAIVFETQGVPVDPASYRSHGFFQQLEWVDTDSSFVRDCVIHFVQAQATRVRWTDADAVSETALLAYEDDLRSRWKLQVRKQSHRTFPTPVAQGQALLTETLSEDSALDGQVMPKAITCGSFHALANFDERTDPQVGWHPDFEKMAGAARGRT